MKLGKLFYFLDMLIFVNLLEQSLKFAFIILIVFSLWACRTLPAVGDMPPTISLTDVDSTYQSAAATILAETMAPTLTATITPTNTRTPTNTPRPSPTPSRTPLPFTALPGLRVAYIIDGNLYMQDSGKQAVQLTRSGQDHAPLFSDDGQKIMFFRKGISNKSEMWVINADGSGEQPLVTSEKLASFGQGHDETTELRSPAFMPTTHHVLFTTNNQDLFVVNTDTGELKQLMMPGDGGFFLASPNGKYIAVQTLEHIDVIDIHGQIIRHNLVSYSYDSYDCAFYGYICAPMSWTQNSSELIVVQPIPLSEMPTNRGNPLVRTVWRYPVDGRPGIEIRLDPPPMNEAFSISPDVNWIAYSLFDISLQDGVYLGNLSDGTVQLIYKPELNEETGIREPAPVDYDGWNPDSTYFLFGDLRNRLFVGNVSGESALLGNGWALGWIDTDHYLLYDGSSIGKVSTQARMKAVETLPGIDYLEPIAFVFLER